MTFSAEKIYDTKTSFNVAHGIPRSAGRRDDKLTVGRPLDVGRIWSLELRDLLLSGHVPHLDVAAKVAESGEHENVALRIVEGHVARPGAEVEDGFALLVEDGGLGGHEAVDDAELRGRGGPTQMVDGPVFGELDHGRLSFDVEVVQLSFAVVRSPRLVDFGLSEQDD